MCRWHSPPAELYALVEDTPATVLLETAKASAPEPHAGSASRLFTRPLRVLIANESAELASLFAEIESAVKDNLYAAGFFAYECGHFFESTVPLRQNSSGSRSWPTGLGSYSTSLGEKGPRLGPKCPASSGTFSGAEACGSLRRPRPKTQEPAGPLAWFGIYDRSYLFNHSCGCFIDGDPPGLEKFRGAGVQPTSEVRLETSLALTEQQYAARIASIHEWIRAGDVYQLNFAVPMQVHAPGSSAALYQRLRNCQPVPYGAFLHCQPGQRILSFSPELFFRIEKREQDGCATRRITTQPMKGTARRGRTTREDRDLAECLRSDPKNRSENVMIVDLLRNDLGRLCNYGSVRAENLFAVERYPTLLQMTSTVSGELRPEVGFQQILRALFPCGSITGAPKVRAMQLIGVIEEQLRGVYTGAIGFFGKEESVFNVAIRTLQLDGANGTMGVGSGIVLDSDPAGEFRECLLKAEFLTRGLSPSPDAFSLIETLLWNGGFPLIELHLDRLEDSACYFGFRCERSSAKGALLAEADGFPDLVKQKVRLLLDSDGNLKIESELLPDSTMNDRAKPARVRMAMQRADPSDPMYFHKTTHRPLYAEALKAAAQAGYDDVLFMNIRGEITEGAIHNIFIEKYGILMTPLVECGLLPGVHRRHIVETRPSTIERVLYLQDLRQADAIYLSNAVHGLRPAIIDWEG